MIQRKGWAQGRADGVQSPGPCAAWAICLASYKSKGVASETVLYSFANHNDLPYPRPGYSPTQRTTVWNDTPGRTKDEVLAAFRKAEAAETERPQWLKAITGAATTTLPSTRGASPN